MNKVHFFKSSSEEGKIMTVRKGVFKDPVKDGLQFVFAKACSREDKACNRDDKSCSPDIKTGDRIIDNMLSNHKSRTGDANLVFGWANVTVDESGEFPEDFQGDMIPTEILEAAAYSFALNKGYCNQEHRYGTDCGYLIECMMFTKEKMDALGIPEGSVPEGLWVGFYIPDDDIFAKVKSGEYAMFSIEGMGRKFLIDENQNPAEPKDLW